ncbi:MAG: helix-turn-helix domain-containing protein [Steroidobacteraceae bacterium]
MATDADAERVRALKAQGKSVRVIAAEVGISKSQVARLLALTCLSSLSI